MTRPNTYSLYAYRKILDNTNLWKVIKYYLDLLRRLKGLMPTKVHWEIKLQQML